MSDSTRRSFLRQTATASAGGWAWMGTIDGAQVNTLENHLEHGDHARPSGLLGPVRVRPVGRVMLQGNEP